MSENTNLYAHPNTPDVQRLGDFVSVPHVTRHTGSVCWDFRFDSRVLASVDGLTEYQVQQALRVLCAAQQQVAGATRAEIRNVLGIQGPGR